MACLMQYSGLRYERYFEGKSWTSVQREVVSTTSQELAYTGDGNLLFFECFRKLIASMKLPIHRQSRRPNAWLQKTAAFLAQN